MSTATATTTSLSGCSMQSMVAGTYLYPGMTSVAASAPMSPSTWPSTCLTRCSNKEPSQTSTSGKRSDSQIPAADANKGPDGSSVVLLLSVFCPESRPREQQLLLSPKFCSRHEGHLQPAQSGRIKAAAALFDGKPAAEGAHKKLDSARKLDRPTSSDHRNASAQSRLSTEFVTMSAKGTTAFDSRHSMDLISGSIPSPPVTVSPATTDDPRSAVLRTVPVVKQIAVAAARHSGAEYGDSKVGAADKTGAQCSCTSAVHVKSACDRGSIGVQRFGGGESSTAIASATASAPAAARAPTITTAMPLVGRPPLDVRQTTATASSAEAAVVAEVRCQRPAPTCASGSAVRSPATLQFQRLISPASCRALSQDLVNNPLFNHLKQQEEARSCHTRQPHPLQPTGHVTTSPATAGAQPSTRYAAGIADAAVAISTLGDRTHNSGDTTDGTTAASTDRSHNRRQRLQQLEERREQLMMNVRGCRGVTDSSHGTDGSSHPRLEVFSLHTSRCS